MKICLNARQEKSYLERASEIMFDYRDKEAIRNYSSIYPDKLFILNCSSVKPSSIDWEEIKRFKAYVSGKFMLGIDNVDLVPECKANQIDFYFTYPITSYDELSAVLAYGSQQVRLGAPLFFDMDNMKKFFPEVKIRVIPNRAYDDKYIRDNGLYGTWIRPEDLMLYDEYIETVDFQTSDPQRERALFRIYIEDRAWPGELDLIIDDFGLSIENALVLSEIGERRLNCRQRCMARNGCHICKATMKLANRDLIESYQRAVVPKYKAPTEEE